MSNGFTDTMERDYLDELFMQDAARIIDTELLEEAAEAQKMEIDVEWLLNTEKATAQQIRKKRLACTVQFHVRSVARIAATFVVVISILFSGVYVSVGAARDAINNFFTGKTNRRATVVYPVNVEGEIYSIIPENWRGPLYATWLPDGYMHATSGTQSDRYWWLCYSHKDSILKTVCIYAWDYYQKPTVDMEECEFVTEIIVQDVPAEIYWDGNKEFHSLIMVKNDLTIQITGTVTYSEIVQIAECLAF